MYKFDWAFPVAGQADQFMTEEQINEIAEYLDCGLRCFIHKENNTIVAIPDTINNPDSDSEEWDEAMEEIDNNFFSYVEVNKMDSHESFKIMEDFIETIDNRKLQEKLARALNKPRPFRNFKFEVDNSGPYREEWFSFKKQQLIEWVKGQLAIKEL